MKAKSEDYQRQLIDLLPPGPAWSRNPESILGKLLHGQGEELARVHNRALDLIEEADPRTTLELLPDWERVAGLPEPCVDPPDTLDERRTALVDKLTRLGGQSRQFFIDLAAKFGFVVTITEFKPFTAGSLAGDPVNSEEWQYAWQVNAPDTTITSVFRAGQSFAGDPLRDWGNELLECLINRFKPAHTHVEFVYGSP